MDFSLLDPVLFRIDICGGWNDCKGQWAVLIKPLQPQSLLFSLGVIAAEINSFPSSDIK